MFSQPIGTVKMIADRSADRLGVWHSSYDMNCAFVCASGHTEVVIDGDAPRLPQDITKSTASNRLSAIGVLYYGNYLRNRG